jgi:hypothetical protein
MPATDRSSGKVYVGNRENRVVVESEVIGQRNP